MNNRIISLLFIIFPLWCLAQEQWDIKEIKLLNTTYVDEYNDDGVIHLPENLLNISARIQVTWEVAPEATSIDCYYRINEDGTPMQGKIEDIKEGENTISIIDIPIPNSAGIYYFFVGKNDYDMKIATGSITIWSLPEVEIPEKKEIYVFDQSKEVKLGVNVKELSKELLSFQWHVQKDGHSEEQIIEDANKSLYIIPEAKSINDNEVTKDKYHLHWIVGKGGKVWKENDISFNVIIYPIPEYTKIANINNYQNATVQSLLPLDEVTLSVSRIKGAKDDNIFKTVFLWEEEGKQHEEQSYSFIVDENDKSSRTINLVIKSTIEGLDQKNDTLTYSYDIHQFPKVDRVQSQDTTLFNREKPFQISLMCDEVENAKWQYQWKVGDQPINNSNNNIYDVSSNEIKNENDDTPKTFIYSVTATLKGITDKYNKDKEYINQSFIFNIKVLAEPRIEFIGPESFNKDTVTCDGHPIVYHILCHGGDPNGWKFNTDEDNALDFNILQENDTPEVSFSFKNDGESIKTLNCTFTATNTIQDNGNDSKDIIHIMSVQVYPKATINWKNDYLQNYFYGSKVDWELSPSGGYPDNNECKWAYDWYLDGNQKKLSDITTVPSSISDNDSEDHTLSVTATYKYKNATWVTLSKTHSFIAWKRGNLESISISNPDKEDNDNVYEGEKFILKANTTGGYADGWSFKWTRIEDNKSIDSGKNRECEFDGERLNENSNESEDQYYKLEAINKIPGLENNDDIYQKYDSKTITLWRKAENIPTDFTIFIIREGNSIEFNDAGIREATELKFETPTKAIYGYSNYWNYLWNDKVLQSSNSFPYIVPVFQRSDERKYKEVVNYTLLLTNPGPSGESWEEKRIEKPMTVYRKPKTPTHLKKKGNGTSRTLVANMGLDDEVLDDCEYYLVFAHKQSDGNIVPIGQPQLQKNPGQSRWFTDVPANIFSDENNLCVYSQWKYDDNVTITSGLLYFDGTIDDEWDGSDYSKATRGIGNDATAIIGYQSSNPSTSQIRDYYNQIGLKMNHLARGLNIVKMNNGVVRKIIKK